MKTATLLVSLIPLLFLPAITTAAPPALDSPNAQLGMVRMLTAKYHDPVAAVADGYLPTEECVSAPGLGAMGYHYLNPGLFDPIIDWKKPEVILYIPTEQGPRLVAVEYVALTLANTPQGPSPWFPETPPSDGWYSPVPSLFGRSFNGPMPGHFPGMPWHTELHVWLWSHNPDGILAGFNPRLSCP